MPLRGKKPEQIEKRFKALFYGEAGVGKTMASIQFPAPYLVDTERGCENDQYIKLLEKNNGAIFQCSDYDDLMMEIKTLLKEKHPYKTLIIDPLTIIYNNLLESAEAKVGNEFGRHYGVANQGIKKLLSLLLRLDMNVIITAHSKNEYGDKMNVLGQVPDCYKKLNYLFDLVIEIKKRGTERVGFVKKSRIINFNELETFPFSYTEIAKRYGNDILEKEVTPVALSSEKQIEEVNKLIDLLKIETEVVNKWFKKADCESFEDMDAEIIKKCIDALKEKMK